MSVLVDTSVWVDFFNGYPSPQRAALGHLVEREDAEDLCTCGIVVAEVFQGLRHDRSRAQIRALFGELTFLEAGGMDVYLRAAEIHRVLRASGKTVRSTVDCLIAAIAEVNACHVLARDRDLDLILESGVVRVGAWPAR